MRRAAGQMETPPAEAHSPSVACFHPSLASSPTARVGWGSPRGTFTPTQGRPLLPSSEPAELEAEEIHSDQNWSCLVQKLELNHMKSRQVYLISE